MSRDPVNDQKGAMRTRRRASRTACLSLALAALLVGACGASSDPPTTAVAATATPLPSDIAYAVHQREVFGLRADVAWVEAVAADPRASTRTLDIPLLPDEDAAFIARQADMTDVAKAVRSYAAGFPEEFGGVYLDQLHHTAVALWTARPSVHRIAILQLLGRAGPLQVRLVRYTEQALDALQERITADWDWMASIGARPMGAGVEVIGNLVSLQVSSANALAPSLILAHYGVPADMLRVDSDGTGVFLLPRGRIRGTVVTADGSTTTAGDLMLDWSGDGPGECGGGDVGFGVDHGRFELPCSPGGWTIEVTRPRPGEGWEVVGRGHVVVPAGGIVELRIVLDEGAASGS